MHDPDHFLSGCVKIKMKIREDQLSWNCIVHLLGHYSDYYLDFGWQCRITNNGLVTMVTGPFPDKCFHKPVLGNFHPMHRTRRFIIHNIFLNATTLHSAVKCSSWNKYLDWSTLTRAKIYKKCASTIVTARKLLLKLLMVLWLFWHLRYLVSHPPVWGIYNIYQM